MTKYKTIEDFKDQIPEGATHYVNEDCSNNFAFFKLVDGEVEIAIPRYNQSWITADYDSLDEIENLIALTPVKQQEWNGEGYPPVGVECEISNCRNPWVRCLVKFIGTDLCVVDHENFEQHYHLKSVKFRPLETSEQKKELEELEAAYDLFLTFYQGINVSFEEFSASYDTEDWIRIVRKTNYTPSDTMNS